MLKQLMPPVRERQAHYRFMRPLDLVWFVLLLIITAWKFSSAYHLAERYFMEWVSYATISLVLAIWYAWIRFKRRHSCDDAGELMIALMLPQAYKMVFQHYTEGDDPSEWGLFWVLMLLLLVMAYQVWRAPKRAKELKELELAAEDEAMNGPAAPRFIDKP